VAFFFIVLTFVGNYFLQNLVLAIIKVKFAESQDLKV